MSTNEPPQEDVGLLSHRAPPAPGFKAEYFALPRPVTRLGEVDFTVRPTATGTVAALDTMRSQDPFWAGGPRDHFAARYTGSLNLDAAGRYAFFLSSDDGAALYINGARVINSDLVQATTERRVTLDLGAGDHAIEVRYFERTGEQSLRLEWRGPETGGQRTLVTGPALSQEPPAPPNIPPVATDDAASTRAGRSVLINVLANDRDADGDALAITGVGPAANGVAILEAGRIRYTPAAGFHGADTFVYTVSDGHGGVDTATVRVAVAPPSAGFAAEYFVLPRPVSRLSDVNFAATPSATGAVAALDFGSSNTPFWTGGPRDGFAARYTAALKVETAGSYTFRLTSDDGSALFVDGVRVINNDRVQPATARSVTIDLAAGSHAVRVLYFENDGDQALRLEWRGPDTGGVRQVLTGRAIGAAPAPANRPPVADDDAATTVAGQPVLINVLGNDRDPDGDALTITGIGPVASGVAAIVNGQIRYTPTSGFSGVDEFVYTVADNRGGVDTATVRLTVTPAANRAPVAADDAATIEAGHSALINVLANDRDADGDALSITGVGAAAHGVATVVNGQIRYVPQTGFAGADSFEYTVSDGRGGVDAATVRVTVTAPSGGHDHGGGASPPRTPAEIEAFVAAVKAEPDSHGRHYHPDDSRMALEHSQLLNLVPRAQATHVAIADGDWFDASTWHQGRIPGDGARVLIPHGVSVEYDGTSNASLFTVRVDGELSFATDVDTRILLDTMVISPSGRLEIGTAADPMRAGVEAQILIANNGNINLGWDPALLSRGVLSHGEVEIHGAEKTAFLKVAATPRAGDTTIRLADTPDGWRVGDTIVLTGTHKQGFQWDNGLRRVVHRESQDEEVTITAINGSSVRIDRPLQFNHDTPRSDLAAYVANTTRNVTFASADGESTAVHHRGHTMFMHSSNVDVRFAAFDDLGRTDKSAPAADLWTFSRVAADTNVKGRYSLHFHKTGTEDQDRPAISIGNTVSGSPGWGFVHHSSHANFVDNVAFDVFGAAFAAEDGDETGMWLRNMAIRGEGFASGDYSAKLNADVERHDNGRTGDGFFFAGRLVEAAENVAANTTNGFVWMHRSAPTNPLTDTMHQPEIGHGARKVNVNSAVIQGFRDNEAFGTTTGLMVIKAGPAQGHDVRTVMDGFLNWETSEGVILSYTGHYTVKNVDLIHHRGSGLISGSSTGIMMGNSAIDLVFNGLKAQGFATGAWLEGEPTTFSGNDFANFIIDPQFINVRTPYLGFNPARHRILNSNELTPGRLEFDMRGDRTISVDETFRFNGIKTDSIGARNRQFDGDPQEIGFYMGMVTLLATQGYYTTPTGAKVVLVEDYVADRATGVLKKLAHVVTLDMTDAQIRNVTAELGGAVYNGVITPGGQAPVVRNDSASTAQNRAIRIDVLANDRDPEGRPLRVDGMTDPRHGDVSLQGNGEVLYRPNHNFTGVDSFNYWATDGNGNYSRATVTVEVGDSIL